MTSFPAWFYGPDGDARIFESADDIPEGWADTPAAFDMVAEVENDGTKRRPGRPRKDVAA